MDISNLLDLGINRPVLSREDRSAALGALAVNLPSSLVDLYARTDGFLTPQGVGLYAAADLAERNETFEVGEYSPGFLLIGDNSAGRGYLLSLDPADQRVYSSDLGDLGPEDFEVEADSLAAWILTVV